MESVLVTGCAGYIGTVLCQKLLDAGHTIYGIDNLYYKQTHELRHLLTYKNFHFKEADIRRSYDIIPFVNRADVIVHLAALVGAPICDRHKEDAKTINFEATNSLCYYVKPHQRIIYPNTNSGYGTKGDEICTEESPITPISLYGETKCKAEISVLNKPNSVSLRLATVFGLSPRMRFDLMVNDFVGKLTHRKKLKVYQPNFKRNFVHIKDVVACMHHLIKNSQHVGIFNVGNDILNMTKLELAWQVGSELGVERNLISCGEGEDPDKRDYIVSNAKIMAAGYKFRYNLADGIRAVSSYAKLHTHHQLTEMGNVI